MYYTYLQDDLMRQLGVPELRPWQEAPFEAILSGHDVFITAPTGGGKSLLYQLPALMGDGLTLVISPLKALQVDQITKLQAKGFPAVCCNSDQTKTAREQILNALSRIRLLYIAPEQLQNKTVWEALMRCHVNRIVIDEAHILPKAQLGFRQAYGKIGEFIASLPRRPQIIACTATATKKIQKQILRSLEAEDADIFQVGVRRENLTLQTKKLKIQRSCVTRLSVCCARGNGMQDEKSVGLSLSTAPQ